MEKVAVVFSTVPDNASDDEKDVLVEVDSVVGALLDLGCDSYRVEFSTDLEKVKKILASIKSTLIFNLVESVESSGRLIALAPILFDHLKIPYTGSGSEAVWCTSNKLIAKKIMTAYEIMSPYYQTAENIDDTGLWIEGICIVKSVWEHASIGLDEDSVLDSKDKVIERVSEMDVKDRKNWFVEQFIDGREFNVSIIERDGLPFVLPPVEMVFNFPEGKPAIAGYTAKWKEDSFEYKNSTRRFEFDEKDDILLQRIREISEKCWNAFGLKGYARVDFRVDNDGMPWVLEVNINPCISPDAGFVVAAKRSGMDYKEMIRIIVVSALERDKKNEL